MTPARAHATGHHGRAHQLEIFLNAEDPTLLPLIHGLFIDQDMPPDVGAYSSPCQSAVPPITGATKPCVFVKGAVNQEALQYNSGAVPGGHPRDEWRRRTFETLRHEVQHIMYDAALAAGRPEPAGESAGCDRNLVVDGRGNKLEYELSELNAILSEFVIAFRAIPPGAGPGTSAYDHLYSHWIPRKIGPEEASICGILTTMRAQPSCSCEDVNKHVMDTYDFVTGSWTEAERLALNSELRKPTWNLFWPIP